MYIAQARHEGKSVRVTLGRHGVITADEARGRASRVINRIRAGEKAVDAPLPAKSRSGPTVADLAARYMEQHVGAHCRDSTAASLRKLIDGHILPAFGRLPLMAVEREQVAAFHAHRIGIPATANRAVTLLSHMYAKVADWGMVPDGTDPCRGIEKYPQKGRERFLTDTEFRRLGEVLSKAPSEGGVSIYAVAAIRLLMLTGCRKNEILTLKWKWVDLEAGEMRLPETKTAPRTVPLSPAAVQVLAELPRIEGNPWVIPGQKPGNPHGQPGPAVAERPQARRDSGSAAARLPPFLRQPGAGTRREPAGHREAARARPHPDDGALRPPCAGFRPGLGGAGGR